MSRPTPRENLAIHLAETERKTVSVDQHKLFIDSLLTDDDHDDLDRELDDMIVLDPYECHAPSRRSDRDLGALLNLLDSLENGNDRKEATR